jgi:hypothetical protein
MEPGTAQFREEAESGCRVSWWPSFEQSEAVTSTLEMYGRSSQVNRLSSTLSSRSIRLEVSPAYFMYSRFAVSTINIASTALAPAGKCRLLTE